MAEQKDLKVLEVLDGGWIYCRKPNGDLFYFNLESNAVSREAPTSGGSQPTYKSVPVEVEVASDLSRPLREVSEVPVLTQALPSMLLLEGSDWQVCRDQMGEFYFHIPTNRTFTEAPPELQRLLQNRGLGPPPPPGFRANQAPPPQMKWGFHVHDQVIWNSEDEDVPKGEVGRVVGFCDDRVRVKWSKDFWDMKPSDITKVGNAIGMPGAGLPYGAPQPDPRAVPGNPVLSALAGGCRPPFGMPATIAQPLPTGPGFTPGAGLPTTASLPPVTGAGLPTTATLPPGFNPFPLGVVPRPFMAAPSTMPQHFPFRVPSIIEQPGPARVN